MGSCNDTNTLEAINDNVHQDKNNQEEGTGF